MGKKKVNTTPEVPIEPTFETIDIVEVETDLNMSSLNVSEPPIVVEEEPLQTQNIMEMFTSAEDQTHTLPLTPVERIQRRTKPSKSRTTCESSLKC